MRPIFRHRRFGTTLVALCAAVLTSLPASLFAQDEAELRRQLRLVQEEIDREQKLRQREQERDNTFAVSANERLKRLQSEKAVVKAQTDSLAAELRRLEAARTRQISTARWYAKRHDDHNRFLAGYADSLAELVKADFPYAREERLRSLEALKEQLSVGAISPEEGTDRLWSMLLAVLRSGSGAENWSGTLATPEGELSGKYLRLGAVFMATDYTTSPVNPTAQIVFGVGCGALTVFIRYFGSYAEGVSYAILIMNAAVWLRDKAFPRKRFGAVKTKKEAA